MNSLKFVSASLLGILVLMLNSCSPYIISIATKTPDQESLILKRARIWVQAKVPYGSFGFHNNPPLHDGYKADCSGFVSYAWGLEAPGIGTNQFVSENYATVISISDLQPGDVLNNDQADTAGHMVIFVKWLDRSKNIFDAYDLNTDPGYTSEKTYTLAQASNSTDWTISELDPWAPGPYQAERIANTGTATTSTPTPAPTRSSALWIGIYGSTDPRTDPNGAGAEEFNAQKSLYEVFDSLEINLTYGMPKSSSELTPYDVVIFDACAGEEPKQPLIDLIQDYINSGGSVIVMGDNFCVGSKTSAEYATELTSEWGIEFVVEYGSREFLSYYPLVNNPLTVNIKSIYIIGRELLVKSPSYPLFSNNDKIGVAVYDGTGTLVAIPDTMFGYSLPSSPEIEKSDNFLFWHNMLQWLIIQSRAKR